MYSLSRNSFRVRKGTDTCSDEDRCATRTQALLVRVAMSARGEASNLLFQLSRSVITSAALSSEVMLGNTSTAFALV